MFIKKIRLKNFKRFSDLEVDLSEIPAPPRLVLLIGANGSGKSSVFDAFSYVDELLRMGNQGTGVSGKGRESRYLAKEPGGYQVELLTNEGPIDAATGLISEESLGRAEKILFYGRTAFRTVHELPSDLGQGAIDLAQDRPKRFIEPDRRFLMDIRQIADRILKSVFVGKEMNVSQLRDQLVNPINDSICRIFGDDGPTRLRLISLNPFVSGPAEILFRKGESTFHYDMLSSGEKEVVTILLNFFARRDFFRDTVYYIDELDVHLHTSLQHALLTDIVEFWLPEGCQLWTASHSLGFIQYANESAHAAIVDFDELDFDAPQRLTASPKDSLQVFDIAVPKKSAIKVFPNRKLVLCENTDAALYNGARIGDFLFIGRRDKNAVTVESQANTEFLGLIDRDYLGGAEIAEVRKRWPQLRVLPWYSVESFLFHPENIAEVAPAGFTRAAYEAEIVLRKNLVRDKIVSILRETRRSYEAIRELQKSVKSAAEEEIIAATRSDEFAVFYPFLDMKSYRPSDYLGPLNLSRAALAGTRWFRDQIAAVLTK